MQIRVIDQNTGKEHTITAKEGQTVLDALNAAKLTMKAPCGGNKTCGKCLVEISGLVEPPDAQETGFINDKPGFRLACFARPAGDCCVTIPKSAEDSILGGVSLPEFSTQLSQTPAIGAAVDIGTTTIVVYLFDLQTAGLLATVSQLNRQHTFGADVISRINYTMTNENGLETVTNTIRQQLGEMIAQAVEKAGRDMYEMEKITVSANTVMCHLFCGIDAQSIAQAPFTPQSYFGQWLDSSKLGLCAKKGVYVVRAVSGYVGGDITAGMLTCRVDKSENPVLFLDIGTNGEMVIGNNKRIITCATAAGPAFEGANIVCGVGAVSGAINRVEVKDGKLEYTTIKGAKPIGICGSGLVDLLAALLEIGAVDETGRLLPPDEAPEVHGLEEDENGDVTYIIDKAANVYITGADIRNLQLAKAAIAAGIATLLEVWGIKAEQVEALYLAGGFGNYIDKHSAIKIGLFPKEIESKVSSVGNSAGNGAVLALLSDAELKQSGNLAQKCEYLELSSNGVFMENYVECMMF